MNGHRKIRTKEMLEAPYISVILIKNVLRNFQTYYISNPTYVKVFETLLLDRDQEVNELNIFKGFFNLLNQRLDSVILCRDLFTTKYDFSWMLNTSQKYQIERQVIPILFKTLLCEKKFTLLTKSCRNKLQKIKNDTDDIHVSRIIDIILYKYNQQRRKILFWKPKKEKLDIPEEQILLYMEKFFNIV